MFDISPIPLPRRPEDHRCQTRPQAGPCVGHPGPLAGRVPSARPRLCEVADSKLRGCDLVALRVSDLVSATGVKRRVIVLQQKASRPASATLDFPRPAEQLAAAAAGRAAPAKLRKRFGRPRSRSPGCGFELFLQRALQER